MTTAAVATHLVEVEFKGNRRAFYTWTGDAPPKSHAAVIVQVERGEDLGRIHSTGELAEKRKAGTSHGKASPTELPAAVRLATKQEIDTAVRLRVDESAVRKAALELVRQMNLDMKVSDTEWQWDRRRLTCYFTAEERVDFRQLVRQLEKRFATRVHMWHIGVRDEARRLDGVGRCGRQFCSSSWLPELRPVKSSSAKDQRLSTLNPAQISGTCGRLMCCLRHEHEFYVQSRKRFPKEGKVVTTAEGEEKIVSNDIFRDQVTLRTAGGELRTIPLAQLRRELGDSTLPVDDDPARDDDGADERELVTLGRATEPAAVTKASTIAKRVRTATEPSIAAHADQREDSEPHSGDDSVTELDAATAATTDSTTGTGAEADAPRGRRRRGRRGGRRGRGGDGNPGGSGPPNPGAPDAPPAT